MARRDCWPTAVLLLKLAIIVVLNLNCAEMTRQDCSKGITTPGYTVPSDDIVLEYGNPLDITCNLNDDYQELHPNITSDSLYFENSGAALPNDMITVLNSSSIHLHIDRPEMSESVYTCKLKNAGGVCLNTVHVGSKPVFIDDLNCTGSNYENMTCSWTTQFNPVRTFYSIRYYIGGNNNRHLSNNCPILRKFNKNRMSCSWTLTTDPPYKQAQTDITFQLSAHNQLGTAHLQKSFSHFKYVIPAPPENVTCVNTTAESVVVKWSISNPMQKFPPGLLHRVIYKSKFDKDWQVAKTLFSSAENKTKRISYNLTSLYAYTQYDVGVAMRSAAADPDDNSTWSEYSYTTIKTKSKIPGRPPPTTIGSFESVNIGNIHNRLRDVYVYWQQLSEQTKNGRNFKYEVEEEKNGNLKPVEVTPAYAKFANLSLDERYVFKIWSSNNIGRSKNFSSVVVPIHTQGFEGPAHFTKIIRDDYGYELSWDPLTYPVDNLTIFACAYDRDRPYQCTGTMHWKFINPNRASYMVDPPDPQKIYQFAISANSETFISGMVWADCTVISNQVRSTLKNVWINQVGSTYITLNWKLDCSERIGGIEGFSVRYCNYDNFSNGNCDWFEINISGRNVLQANITNLMPYTKYAFVVVKSTKTMELLQHSDYLFEQTLEAAPTPPTNIKVMDSTNSSISISWGNPDVANGIINRFVISKNNQIYMVNATSRLFTFQNLTSYTNYNISLCACTVECSRPSKALLVKTQGGYPSKIDQPGVTFQNDSITMVGWERPKLPNGDCDYYEVRIKERRRYENKTLSIKNTTEPWYVIEDCGSRGIQNSFLVSVRAVNILNGTRYEGIWSDELQSYCRHPSNTAWIWALGPSLIILAFLIYLGRRMYYNYQKMRDIEVKLPPGLEAFVITSQDHRLSIIEAVSLNEIVSANTKKSRFSQENKERCYKPLNSKATNPPGNVIPEYSAPEREYVTMSNTSSSMESNEIRYVKVGDILPPQKRNSIVLVANNVTINTGYVTVMDVQSAQRS